MANKKSNSIARFESTTPVNRNDLNQKQTNLLQTDKINEKYFDKLLINSPSVPTIPRTNTPSDRNLIDKDNTVHNKLRGSSPRISLLSKDKDTDRILTNRQH